MNGAGIARAQEALRAGRNARIVRHARLLPARDEDAAQMRFAVEDALNTADFADCGRLILVRRLRLHAVPPRAGAAQLARALESAWRALATRAVEWSHPRAGAADAVFFGSRFEARVGWLKLVAAGAETSAWYWPVALPELKQPRAAGEARSALGTVVEALLQESATETVQALRAWPEAALARLARLATEAVNRRLLETLVATAADEPDLAAESALAAAPEATASAVARRLAGVAPLPAVAASWIAALWLGPGLRGPPSLARVRAVVTRAARLQGTTGADTPARVSNAEAAPSVAASDGARRATSLSAPGTGGNATQASAPAPPASAPLPWRLESGLRSEQHYPSTESTGHGRAAPALPWLADAAATGHGGLLCLLNLLQVLPFERWLANQAPALRPLFVNALLAQTLAECGAGPGDPQQAWFDLSPADAGRLSSAEFGVDASGATIGAPRALRQWRWRMRRALRRHAGLDLAVVVQRQAWVAATATHLDVVFPLDEVDLRLRRHGLDSDPGWVAWFGRIVGFHFVAAELLPRRAPASGGRDG